MKITIVDLFVLVPYLTSNDKLTEEPDENDIY